MVLCLLVGLRVVGSSGFGFFSSMGLYLEKCSEAKGPWQDWFQTFSPVLLIGPSLLFPFNVLVLRLVCFIKSLQYVITLWHFYMLSPFSCCLV